jgi:hypothetical protein
MLRPVIHILLHLLIPGIVARFAFNRHRLKRWLVMVSMLIIDLDHLAADPIYDPNRCSIGFHPLHAWFVIPIYGLLACWDKTRIIGLGLIIHIGVDLIDCLWMALC